MPLTVLLADDHPIVRKGLLNLLEIEPDFQVVGEAGDGLEAVQLAERSRPNILILDLMMSGLNGLEVLRQVRERSPATRIIILSVHANEAYVLQALKNGASGYILKDTGPTELIDAIRRVSKGQRYLSPPLSERLIDAFVMRASDLPADPYETLTQREREVFQLSAEGCSNAEIADRLSISPRTAEIHRSKVMDKLNLHSQTELIRFAFKRGLLSLD